MSKPVQQIGEHAVVLGASMAGLLAARALAGRFARVTLIEKDLLPAPGEPRKGVPQGRHAHVLLGRGATVLEGYFPGLRAELTAAGVPSCDGGLGVRFLIGRERLRPVETGSISLYASRPLLEGMVRQRLLQLPNIALLEGHEVRDLVADAHGRRIEGVRVAARDGLTEERLLPADLVVDASGRGSRTPLWLTQIGFQAPAEELVEVDVSYVTRQFRWEPGQLAGDFGIIVPPEPPYPRAAAALRQEGGRWMVTLVGCLGLRVPSDLAGFVEFARGYPRPDLAELLREAEPLGGASVASFPASVRRYYERLPRFPERYVVIGDAICSFNPIFGQGMTVAALEAQALEATLADGLTRVGRRFFARAGKVLQAPWMVVVGNDQRFPEVRCERTLKARLINSYLARYRRSASIDPALSLALSRVSNLQAAPASLLAPALVMRVLSPRPAPAHAESTRSPASPLAAPTAVENPRNVSLS